MKGHVEKVAAKLEAEGYEVELFNEKSQGKMKFEIDGETKSWEKISKDFGNQDKYTRNKKGWITDKSLPDTDMYKANQQWAEKLVNEGYEIIDVGYPEGTTTGSVFYNMEQQIIFK